MNFAGHARNASAGQHLIVDRQHESGDEEEERRGTTASPIHPLDSQPQPVHQVYEPVHPADNKNSYNDPRLRSNIKVVIGSIVLTIAGAVFLVLGLFVTFTPLDTGLQGWVFLFAGLLFFIPGFYHVFYITCTLCGRPGYSFDNLPTFQR